MGRPLFFFSTAEVLPEVCYKINKFPFTIGRKRKGPLAHNNLSIQDTKPYQISRHHVTIINKMNHIGVVDMWCTLRVEVNGKRLRGNNQKLNSLPTVILSSLERARKA